MLAYLVWFTASAGKEQFALHELCSVAQVLKVPIQYDEFPPQGKFENFEGLLTRLALYPGPKARLSASTVADSTHLKLPAVTVLLSSDDDAAKISQRMILLKGIFRLHGFGNSMAETIASIGKAPLQNLHFATQQEVPSFRYTIESFGKKISESEKREIIVQCQDLPHRGVISLVNPDVEFLIVKFAMGGESRGFVFSHVSKVCDNLRQEVLDKYDLKKRPYIGTTSMPPELTFIMVNLALVSAGDFVYDPFCGTGSTLVSASHFGAQGFGSDMDGRAMQKGTVRDIRSKLLQQAVGQSGGKLEEAAIDEGDVTNVPSMLTNFEAYGLRPPERFRLNFSVWKKFWRPLQGRSVVDCGFLDSIISDPPYGVRERKKQSAEGDSLVDYETREMVLDLVLFAGEALKVGGRLVYWHPTGNSFRDEEIPKHPHLKLWMAIEQFLSLKSTRWLVVLEKVSPCIVGSLDRDSIRPMVEPPNLRILLDETNLPDNEAYVQYRSKKEKHRIATQTYKDAGGSTTRRELTRSEQRQATMENRVKNGILALRRRHLSDVRNKTQRDLQLVSLGLPRKMDETWQDLAFAFSVFGESQRSSSLTSVYFS